MSERDWKLSEEEINALYKHWHDIGMPHTNGSETRDWDAFLAGSASVKTANEVFREIEKLIAYSGENAAFMSINRHQYEWLKSKFIAALKAGRVG